MKEKIVKFNSLVEIIEQKRRLRKTVGLANGVFDILHVGHIRYLSDASKMVDVLVVAIDSDRWTRTHKGPDRPLTPEDERAEIIASIDYVDYVFIFDGPLSDYILRLKPDLQIKGRDYTPIDVPERSAVESYGGKVVIAGDPKDHSSSDIIKKIKNGGY